MVRDLFIVGAGPSGLAAAIAAKQQGLDYVIVEKGALVNSIFQFPSHMVFFTTPELLEIGGLPLITPYDKPTRLEALRYYRRVVDTHGLQIAFDQTVTDIERDKQGIFYVVTRSGTQVTRSWQARAVILAIGYYDLPNFLNVPGEELPHVSHYYREAHSHYRQRVVVVGGKNSAAEAALELYRAGAHVTLIHRHAQLGESIKYWVKPDIENRLKEGSIASRFEARVIKITPSLVVIEHNSFQKGGDAAYVDDEVEREEVSADAVYLLTGYHPDVELMQRAGVHCHAETMEPQYDPNTFETNVPNLFVSGGAVAGRNTGSIFIENGRFHGEQIVKLLADRVKVKDRNV